MKRIPNFEETGVAAAFVGDAVVNNGSSNTSDELSAYKTTRPFFKYSSNIFHKTWP